MSPAPLVQIREATHDVVIDMMYARPDNFTGQVIYGHSFCFLHPEAEACLRRAVAGARGFGYKLKIFDAFRPHEAQEALWAVLPVPGYVADPAKGSNHTRGVAVDLTLLDADGQELDMGTPVDTMTPASHHFYAGLPAAVQLNRMKLLTIMLEAGFVHHAMEWWHYQLPEAKEFELVSSAVFAGCLDAAA
jgi:D-alanyl-D-alanine dipeptidase